MPRTIAARPATAKNIDADGLRLHLAAFVQSGQIPKYAVPERIEFVETIPKTSVGKIDKKHLRVMLGAGVPEPPN